jgi:hypothetical protein
MEIGWRVRITWPFSANGRLSRYQIAVLLEPPPEEGS